LFTTKIAGTATRLYQPFIDKNFSAYIVNLYLMMSF